MGRLDSFESVYRVAVSSRLPLASARYANSCQHGQPPPVADDDDSEEEEDGDEEDGDAPAAGS